MNLRELVEKYVHAAGGYGKSVPISSLDLSHEETERIFDMLDEDYHISRFFHFSKAAGQSFRLCPNPHFDRRRNPRDFVADIGGRER